MSIKGVVINELSVPEIVFLTSPPTKKMILLSSLKGKASLKNNLSVCFLAILIGAHFYPGGNHLDASQEGYSYTLNFLSELGFYNTLSGENNFIPSFFR